MHTNSLTPMQISETQRSFLNFRIDSSYYGTVDMENLGYTARRSTTAAISNAELAGALRKTDRVVFSMPLGSPLVEALEQLDRFAKEVMPAFRGAKVAAAAE